MKKKRNKRKLLVIGAAFILGTSCFTGPVLADPADALQYSGSSPIHWEDQSGNEINWGEGGVAVKGTNNVAVGNVGIFYGNANGNKIEVGIGAEVVDGIDNQALGNTGIFVNSNGNHIWNGTDSDTKSPIVSIGAYVEAGKVNHAYGDVGIFTNFSCDSNKVSGNTVYGSDGAVILNGIDNNAYGVAGSFVGMGGTIIGNTILQNSVGAYIKDGMNNLAIGSVGTFTASQGVSMSENRVAGIGAAVLGGNDNRAIGTVGQFHGLVASKH